MFSFLYYVQIHSSFIIHHSLSIILVEQSYVITNIRRELKEEVARLKESHDHHINLIRRQYSTRLREYEAKLKKLEKERTKKNCSNFSTQTPMKTIGNASIQTKPITKNMFTQADLPQLHSKSTNTEEGIFDAKSSTTLTASPATKTGVPKPSSIPAPPRKFNKCCKMKYCTVIVTNSTPASPIKFICSMSSCMLA